MVLLILLAGCSQNSPTGQGADVLDPGNPVALTLWHYYVGDNKISLEKLIAEFNQSVGIEQGVIIEPVGMGSVRELEALITDSAKGVINSPPMPDIFSTYPDKAKELDQLVELCDLNNYFSHDERGEYVEDFISDGLFQDGRLLLLPIVKSTELLYLNATSWEEFAKDTAYELEDLATWEGILDIARSYYKWTDGANPDTLWDGCAFFGYDSVANYILAGNRQLGVEIIDGDKEEAHIDRKVLRKLFDIYVQGIGFGYFDAIGKFRADDIKARDLIAYVGSSSSAAYFPTWVEEDNQQKPIEFIALPYPAFEGSQEYVIQQGAGMGVVKSTPQKEAGAALFMKWFTSKEQNIEFSITTGYIPVKRETFDDHQFKEAIKELDRGRQVEKNVGQVYEIVLEQVLSSNTYAAKAFDKSYDLRSILQAKLMDVGQSVKGQVVGLKEQYDSEEDILDNLDLDLIYDHWLKELIEDLQAVGISVQVN